MFRLFHCTTWGWLLANGMSAERRRAKRYPLAAPVHFAQGESGTTRNISASGLFFETEATHAVGKTIGLAVDFKDITVQGAGRIVRIEKLNGKFGVAVELTSYGFC